MRHIETQCGGCGRPLTIFCRPAKGDRAERIQVYAWIEEGDEPGRFVTRCPTAGCDRDFSEISIDQLKTGVWGS